MVQETPTHSRRVLPLAPSKDLLTQGRVMDLQDPKGTLWAFRGELLEA